MPIMLRSLRSNLRGKQQHKKGQLLSRYRLDLVVTCYQLISLTGVQYLYSVGV